MKTYKTLEEIYLTFLTPNDSYMERIPVGSILTLEGDDLIYKDKVSIDYIGYYLKYLEEQQVCDICGKPGTYFEPWFLYWSCKEHEHIAPTHRGSATQLEMGTVLKTAER